MVRLLILTVTCVVTLGQTNPPAVKDLGGGILEIGKVRINSHARTVTFPAVVNMRTGAVEYVIVTTGGKTHESVLRTDAEPFHLHAAMLLLGAKGSGESDPALFFDRRRQIPGESVRIFASWEGTSRRPLQELVWNIPAKQAMVLTNWIYNGSRTRDGTFLAQREGSIVSLIADPGALINNPRDDREKDELWTVNTNTVPAMGREVYVTIELAKSSN